MKVLVVGGGAREHAIAWKLVQSPGLDELLVAPGNPGTSKLARNVDVGVDDIDGLLRLAREEQVSLTVVGPEAPLAAGIADRFGQAGLALFGPTQAAARIETSKIFAKRLMQRHGVPTATAEEFSDYGRALRYLASCDLPVVVKADGLAAGKGVVVAETRVEAKDALRHTMVENLFGAAGERVLIEEHLDGEELSVFAFVDGDTVSPLVAARDYKRAYDGDRGPNTGGIGAFSPLPAAEWTPEVEGRVHDEIMEPVAAALREEGTPYVGTLYAGLILTAEGPKVIEFNCRMGDPEAQVVLPRLKTDLLEVMIKTAAGELAGVSLEWDDRACVGVVIASEGYPGSFRTGYAIGGLEQVDVDTVVFHAGTRRTESEGLVSDGGRVVTVSALGDTLAEARCKAYANAGRITFSGSFFRKDIASL